MAPLISVAIRLTIDQREALTRYTRTGTPSPWSVVRAKVLLPADADGPDAWPDEDIPDHLDTSRMTVTRIRKQFAACGHEATVHRKKPSGWQYRKPGGEQ